MMPVDPATATAAVVFTINWMWDSYGKNAVDGLAQRLGRSRERAQLEREWQEATQKYLTKLYDQVNWLRLLGKREGMPLEQIFTDLNVLDKLSAEQWYSRDALQNDFLQRRGFHWRREEVRRDGLAVVKQFPRLYILGKPGAGKTTFLKYVTLEALKGRLGQKLPLFVSLKELSDAGTAILPFMAEQLRQCGFAEAEAFLRQLLAKGDAIVLFDGLDEVNLEQDRRAKQIAAMKAFVQEFDPCQVLITCRIAASDYSFERFKYVEMADFNEMQQQTFIFRWFHDDLARRDACWVGLQAADKEGLRELA
ncbi:MAG: hypothetical protein Fur0021_38540 [Candidatus Promineifilaceae bacterium]